MKQYSTVILRVGLAFVFLWFGIDKFIHPLIWANWVPDWMAVLIPVPLSTFMIIQGVVEVVVGFLLLIGYQTRFAAFLAVVTILGAELAMFGTGQIEIMVRDAGLLAASLSLVLTGSDCLSMDQPKAVA
ncbi:DoxX family protein [Candidatus Woesearchaeota archaeon]|nr:DoxX family protein [Candidatus Woesearchaeota archaeon]